MFGTMFGDQTLVIALIKGEASRFKLKVHEAVPHSTTFQTHNTAAVMVFTLQTMLHKLVVVCTNILISINWT